MQCSNLGTIFKIHTVDARVLQRGRKRLLHLVTSVLHQCMSVHFLLRDTVSYLAADLETERMKLIHPIPLQENTKATGKSIK